MKEKAIIGCILGTAVGDALGLPYERMSGSRGRRLLGPPDRFRFFFRHGLVSDDTDHTCLVAQSLILSRIDPDRFSRSLARLLRWWIVTLPAGVGSATLRSILKLWIGFPPGRSGVFSAGNGPAMRSSLLGVVFGDHPVILKEFVKRSTQITHTDPKAYQGALAVAHAAFLSASQEQVFPTDYPKTLQNLIADQHADEFITLIGRAAQSAEKGEQVSSFSERIGCRNGISGYVFHTVPCVIQTWLRYQNDFSGGIREMISAGGDADTTAAILGGIIGSRVGKEGIPPEWISGLWEWPRTVGWMEQLGHALAQGLTGDRYANCPRLFWPALPIRNLVFLLVVVGHVIRRLAPPY